MKSERAEEYLINHECGYPMDGYVPLMDAGRAVEIAEEEVEERVREELTRWNDPKEKSPACRQVALLKLKDADEEVYYRVGIFLDCRQFQLVGCRLGSEVLGWRPIHE